jgi:hypothetical protein
MLALGMDVRALAVPLFLSKVSLEVDGGGGDTASYPCLYQSIDVSHIRIRI